MLRRTAFSPLQPRCEISQRPAVSSAAISCSGTWRTSLYRIMPSFGRTPVPKATSTAPFVGVEPTDSKRIVHGKERVSSRSYFTLFCCLSSKLYLFLHQL